MMTIYLYLQLLSEATGKLTAHHGDVLRFSMEKLFPEELIKPWDDKPPDIHIIGNLPFNVATPLIFQYMESIYNKTDAWRYGRVPMTLTFQKEVAERMVAHPGQENRCRVSIDVQNLCYVTVKKIIPGNTCYEVFVIFFTSKIIYSKRFTFVDLCHGVILFEKIF